MEILNMLNPYIAFGRMAIFSILIFQSLSMGCLYILLCLLQFLSEFWSFYYKGDWLVWQDLLQSTFKDNYEWNCLPATMAILFLGTLNNNRDALEKMLTTSPEWVIHLTYSII